MQCMVSLKPVMTKQWSLYLIRTRQGALYTGITTDVRRRFDEHCDTGKGAKYLRGRGPLALVYETKIGNRALALKIEYRMKRLKKKIKEQIVSEKPKEKRLIAFLGFQMPNE